MSKRRHPLDGGANRLERAGFNPHPLSRRCYWQSSCLEIRPSGFQSTPAEQAVLLEEVKISNRPGQEPFQSTPAEQAVLPVSDPDGVKYPGFNPRPLSRRCYGQLWRGTPA